MPGKLDIPKGKKMNLNSLLHIIKIISKWINELNVKAKSIKPDEET